MVSYRIISPVVALTLAMLSVAACGILQPTPIPIPTAHITTTRTAQSTPRLIEHPQPLLTVDADIFRTSDSPIIELECEWIHTSDMHGGLEPNHPIAVCAKEWTGADQCLRESGGIMQMCEQVIVYLDGTFQQIGTEQELGDSAKYAPEDYRLSLPGDCDPGPEHYRYYTDVLEDTHVVEVANGYEINLFDSKEFGCGPHPVWSVVIRVYYDGAIAEHRRTKLFEEDLSDPGNSMVCCVD
jgi:hypothetical protein